MENERLLKIYLKSKKKPLKIIVNDKAIEELKVLLATTDIICFASFIFQRDDFLFAVFD